MCVSDMLARADVHCAAWWVTTNKYKLLQEFPTTTVAKGFYTLLAHACCEPPRSITIWRFAWPMPCSRVSHFELICVLPSTTMLVSPHAQWCCGDVLLQSTCMWCDACESSCAAYLIHHTYQRHLHIDTYNLFCLYSKCFSKRSGGWPTLLAC